MENKLVIRVCFFCFFYIWGGGGGGGVFYLLLSLENKLVIRLLLEYK